MGTTLVTQNTASQKRYDRHIQILVLGAIIFFFAGISSIYYQKSTTSANGSLPPDKVAGNVLSMGSDSSLGEVADSAVFRKQKPVYKARKVKTPKQVADLCLLTHSIPGCRVAYFSVVDEQEATDAVIIPLGSNEIPTLPEGMINVTGYAEGYKVKTGQTADKKIRIAIAYDPAKIPAGYTVADINTYMLDKKTGNWFPLKKDSVDLQSKMIISAAPDDGEFINGIIKAPETPETFGYTPTTMKDIKIADPASMVQLIQPPAANNQGSANLSYHIEIPKGRQGIEPNLNLTYNSDGGSGWLGEGWDLSVSKITVDTRWGVPEYNITKETETYNLDGQMLGFYDSGNNFITPHRTLDVNRNTTGPKIFHLKKENSYKKIERLGNTPGTYYWVVTEKNGTKYYYGNRDSSRLRDTDKIAEWYLDSVVDVHGNGMRYRYQPIEDPVLGSSSVKAKNVYLLSIRYTYNRTTNQGQGDSPLSNAYEVLFYLKKDPKPDNTINARYGFPVHNSRFLDSISITYYPTPSTPQLVRAYSFQRGDGVFGKSLLSRITQYGADGKTEFNHHEFAYHNKIVENGGNPFSTTVHSINTNNQGLGNDDIIRTIGTLGKNYSVINGSSSRTNGFSLYVGVGVGDPSSKTFSVGPQFSFSESENNGVTTLVDITGDGLTDKVYRKGNSLFYSKNMGDGTFATEKPISGIGMFSYQTSTTNSFGFQGNVAVATAGFDKSNTESNTDVYFTDANADGLIDIAAFGTVYFNSIGADGHPHFNPSSAATPVPIKPTIIDGRSFKAPNQDSINRENPLQDVVKVWEAPFNGTITITSEAKLIRPLIEPGNLKDSIAYTKSDGVKLSIEYNNAIVKSDTFAHADTETKNLNGTFAVQKGRQVYFRVQSGTKEDANGAFDNVEWNPVITYNTTDTTKDAFGKNKFKYDYKNDFLVTAINGLVSPFSDGVHTINISGICSKEISTDTIYLAITKVNGETKQTDTVKQMTLLPDDRFASKSVTANNISLGAKDTLHFIVFAKANVNIDAVKWYPKFTEVGKEKNVIFPVPEYRYYSNPRLNGQSFLIEEEKEYSIQPKIKIKGNLANGNTIFVIRKNGRVISKVLLSVKDGIPYPIDPLSFTFEKGNEITAAFENPNSTILKDLEAASFLLKPVNPLANTQSYTVSSSGKYYVEPYINVEPPLNGATGYRLLKNNTLIFDTVLNITNNQFTHKRFIERAFSANDNITIQFYNPQNGQLIRRTGPSDTLSLVLNKITDADVWAQRKELKFGEKYRGWGQFVYNPTAAKKVNQAMNEADFDIETTGIDESSVNSMVSSIENQQRPTLLSRYSPLAAKFLGMSAYNDEGIYYYVGSDKSIHIKESSFSSSRLGRKDVHISNPFSPDVVVNAGGAYAIQKRTSSEGNTWTIGGGDGILSASFADAKGLSMMVSDYSDMNGDRIPDVISGSGIQFSQPDGSLKPSNTAVANFTDIHRSSSSLSGGITLGNTFPVSSSTKTAGKSSGSPAAQDVPNNGGAADQSKKAENSLGITFNLGKNNESTEFTLLDINGDGLPDKVYKNGNVRLNLVKSFSDPVEFNLNEITTGETESQSPVSIGFSSNNGSVSGGIGASTGESFTGFALQDINGDGLPDKINENGDVEINTGLGFLPAAKWNFNTINTNSSGGVSLSGSFTAGFIIPLTIIKIVFTPGFNTSFGMSTTRSQLADINGDGFTDYITSDNDGDLKVRYSIIGSTNKLVSVINPLGGKFTIDYKHNKPTYEHSGGKWVMQSVTIDDGIGDDRGTNGLYDSKNVFTYSGGKYDRYNREFLGFAEVVTSQLDFNDSDTLRKQIHRYDTSNYYTAGNLKYEAIVDAKGAVYTFKETEYLNQRLSAANSFSSTKPHNIIGNWETGRFFIAAKSILNGSKEGSARTVLLNKSIFDYDSYGNVEKFGYKENPANAGSTDVDYTTNIEYENKIAQYIIGLPTQTKVSANNVTLRLTNATYNALGMVETITKKLNESSNAVTSFDYDNYGNIKTIKFPSNEKGHHLIRDFKYEGQLRTYVEEVKDIAYMSSNTEIYSYFSESTDLDPRFGIFKTTWDINHKYTKYNLDNFGRTTSIIANPLLEEDPTTTIKFDYRIFNNPTNSTINNYAITTHYDKEHDAPGDKGIQTINICDGFGRSIQINKTAEIDTDASAKWIVSGRIIYDALGRAVQTYYPTTSSEDEPKSFNPSKDIIRPTTVIYDVLDRPLKTYLPTDKGDAIAAFSENIYTISNDEKHLVTQTKLYESDTAIQQISETHTNGSGLKDKDISYNEIDNAGQGIKPITTKYEYDAIHQLKKVINTSGIKVIENEYDAAGRRTAFYQADAGNTKFEYDNAGNLTKKTRADGTVTTYEYEYSRLTDIKYPATPLNNVHYKYGKVSNVVNRIVFQSDASGAQSFEYDNMGNVIENKRTIIVPFDTCYTFTTKFTYDVWNRLLNMTYPDGEVVSYKYNKAGLLKYVKGLKRVLLSEHQNFDYVKSIKYDKFEQRTYIQYGNGVETNYSYEPGRRRLQNLSAGEGGNTKSFMNIDYKYDNINNITDLNNNPLAAPTGLISSFNQHFEYDALSRLAGAQGIWKGQKDTAATYGLAMRYDALYNIRRKELLVKSGKGTSLDWVTKADTLDYSYGEAHQLLKIKTTSKRKKKNNLTNAHYQIDNYAYDEQGNTTTISSADSANNKINPNVNNRQIIWDEENRIKSISINGSVSAYIYDADGNRVVKLSTDNSSVYVNGRSSSTENGMPVSFSMYVSPYFSTRNGGGVYTRHIYVGTERVCSRLLDHSSIHYEGAKPRDKDNKVVCTDSDTFCTEGELNSYPTKLQAHSDAIVNYYARYHLLKPALNNSSFRDFADIKQPAVISPFVKDAGRIKEDLEIDLAEKKHLYYYHSNHISSVNYVTNHEGKVVQHLEYLPFGEVFMEQRDSYSSQFSFNAKEQDEETGLYYYGARYYDPSSYQWLGVDPMVEEFAGLSPYNFNLGNPVKMMDPDGRFANCLTAAIGAGIGASIGGVVEMTSQLYNNRSITDWSAIGGSALQGGITGSAAGFTGGATLLTTLSVAGGANVVGGVANRATQGQETTLPDIFADATTGAILGAGGHLVGNFVSSGTNNLSNSAKGKLGEAITELKFGIQGYKSAGNDVVKTGGRTASGRPAEARFDFKMTNIITGRHIAVESKFNKSGYTSNQKAVIKNGYPVILDRTTSQGLGNGAKITVISGGAGIDAQQ